MVSYENQWLKKRMAVLNLNKTRRHERFKKIVQKVHSFLYPIFSTEGILYQLKTGTVDTEQKSSTQPESARR